MMKIEACHSFAEYLHQHTEGAGFPGVTLVKKLYTLWVLEVCEGNRSEAARQLGTDRVSFHRTLRKLEEEGFNVHPVTYQRSQPRAKVF